MSYTQQLKHALLKENLFKYLTEHQIIWLEDYIKINCPGFFSKSLTEFKRDVELDQAARETLRVKYGSICSLILSYPNKIEYEAGYIAFILEVAAQTAVPTKNKKSLAHLAPVDPCKIYLLTFGLYKSASEQEKVFFQKELESLYIATKTNILNFYYIPKESKTQMQDIDSLGKWLRQNWDKNNHCLDKPFKRDLEYVALYTPDYGNKAQQQDLVPLDSPVRLKESRVPMNSKIR